MSHFAFASPFHFHHHDLHLDIQWSKRVSDLLHIIWAASPATAWFLFAQASASPPDGSDVWGLIERLGLPIVLLVFFVWQAWRDKQALANRMDSVESLQKAREDRMAERISILERFQEESLLKMVGEAHVLVSESNSLKAQLISALNAQTEAFKRRPCIHDSLSTKQD